MHLIAKFSTRIVSHWRITRIEVNSTNEISHMFMTARISLKYNDVIYDPKYLHLKKCSYSSIIQEGGRAGHENLDLFPREK